MKVIFDYDEITGQIKDSTGLTICMMNMKPFDHVSNKTVELIKLGVKVEEIIKLKNQGLL